MALAARLRRYLAKLAARDTGLDHDMVFRSLLEEAGHDPLMRECQDRFFDRVYWSPAVQAASALALSTALGTIVVYDSHVHGSWGPIRDRTTRPHGAVAAIEFRGQNSRIPGTPY